MGALSGEPRPVAVWEVVVQPVDDVELAPWARDRVDLIAPEILAAAAKLIEERLAADVVEVDVEVRPWGRPRLRLAVV